MAIYMTDELKADLITFQQMLDTDPQQVERFNNEFDYIPISAIEADLNEIFYGQYDIMIISSKEMFKGIVYDININYRHPISGQIITKSGTGAVTLYSVYKKEGIDIEEYGLVTTLEMAAPLAYAEAIKNAAKKIGRRFGADLNREITSPKKNAPTIKQKAKIVKAKAIEARLMHLITGCTELSDLNKLLPDVQDGSEELLEHFNNKLKQFSVKLK